MDVLCLDLEGVLIPEIWVGVAERTGIEALRKTTRDVPVYDDLMSLRLGILDATADRLGDDPGVIDTFEPLPGAVEFLEWARARFQVAIVSDTFYEFAQPMMAQARMAAVAVPSARCRATAGSKAIEFVSRIRSGNRSRRFNRCDIGFLPLAIRTTTSRCSIRPTRVSSIVVPPAVAKNIRSSRSPELSGAAGVVGIARARRSRDAFGATFWMSPLSVARERGVRHHSRIMGSSPPGSENLRSFIALNPACDFARSDTRAT